MKIATAREYGSPDRVRVEDVPTPTPEADEVLVRVRAASVNRADLDGMYPRWQFTRLFLGVRRPRLPWLGIDVAGTVEATGPEARRFKPGDDVFADIFSHRKKGGERMGLLVGWSPFPDKDVAELKELVAAGAIKPQIDRRFTLAETADALRYVDQGKSRGKVVIIP